MDPKLFELVAVGASVSANCLPCVRYHLKKADEVGLTKQEIADAIDVGRRVRQGAARKMDEYLDQQVSQSPAGESGSSGCGSSPAPTQEKTNG